MPLKYLIIFCRSLEIPLINWKVELKVKRTNYFVLYVTDADTNDADSNNIIFSIKDTKLYVHIVTLSTKDNYLDFLTKDLKSQCIGMNIKQKVKLKIQQFTRYFLESVFLGVNRLFILVYSNQDFKFKRFKARKYYLPKGIIKNYNMIINGKNFYDRPIDSNISNMKK